MTKVVRINFFLSTFDSYNIIFLQSVIITVLNGSKWIASCFSSIYDQSTCPDYEVEIVIFDDASKDDTCEKTLEWNTKLKEKNIELVLIKSESSKPKGGKSIVLKRFHRKQISLKPIFFLVGYGRNIAVSRSSGDWLCFQDIDDVMMPNRIQKQLEAGIYLGNNFVSNFIKKTKT